MLMITHNFCGNDLVKLIHNTIRKVNHETVTTPKLQSLLSKDFKHSKYSVKKVNITTIMLSVKIMMVMTIHNYENCYLK